MNTLPHEKIMDNKMINKNKNIHYCKHCKTKVTPWIQLRRRHPKKNGIVLGVYCLDCGRTIKRHPQLNLYLTWINGLLGLGLDVYDDFKKIMDN